MAQKVGMVFSRNEKKYMLNAGQYENMMRALKSHIIPDEFYRYTISNIYYDTGCYGLIANSMQKPLYKEKLRLRSYGVPNEDSPVFLEIKKKVYGTVFKRRAQLPLIQAERYLNEGGPLPADSQILREIDYFLRQNEVQPKLYLAYDREAYYAADDPSLRLTFDTGIRSRVYALSLSAGDYGEPLYPKGYHLLEIKTGPAIPVWLAQILTGNKIFPISFSKYGKVYTKNFAKEASAAYGEQQIIIRGAAACLRVS